MSHHDDLWCKAVVYSEVKNMKAIENMKNTYHMPNPFIKAAL